MLSSISKNSLASSHLERLLTLPAQRWDVSYSCFVAFGSKKGLHRLTNVADAVAVLIVFRKTGFANKQSYCRKTYARKIIEMPGVR